MFTKVGFASARSRVLSGRAVRGGPPGSGHKRAPVVVVALVGTLLALAAPVTASAASNGRAPGGAEYVPGSLLAAAKANPDRDFQVIVEGKRGRSSDRIADKVRDKGKLKRTFRSISGVASAAWASAAWGSAAWSSAAWGSAAWASAAWASAAWASASEADAALADHAQWDASRASSAWVD